MSQRTNFGLGRPSLWRTIQFSVWKDNTIQDTIFWTRDLRDIVIFSLRRNLFVTFQCLKFPISPIFAFTSTLQQEHCSLRNSSYGFLSWGIIVGHEIPSSVLLLWEDKLWYRKSVFTTYFTTQFLTYSGSCYSFLSWRTIISLMSWRTIYSFRSCRTTQFSVF